MLGICTGNDSVIDTIDASDFSSWILFSSKQESRLPVEGFNQGARDRKEAKKDVLMN